MNKLIYFATAVILAAVLTSCHQDEPDTSDYYWPWDGPFTEEMLKDPNYWLSEHDLYILVVDENGVNILDSITNPSPSLILGSLLGVMEYELITIGDDHLPIKSYIGYTISDDGDLYFAFPHQTSYPKSSKTLTRKFTCAYIFGDEKEHIITADYIDQPVIPWCTYPRKCTRLTIDGKEYEVRDGNRITVVIPRSAD